MTAQILNNIWYFNLDPAFDSKIQIDFTFVDDAYPSQMSTKQYYTYTNIVELPE